MDRKAFITEVLDGRRHERLPRALFGSGLWAYKQTGLKPEELSRSTGQFIDALSNLYEKLDTDMLFLGSGLNSFPAEAISGVLNFRGEQAPLLVNPVIYTQKDIQRIETIDLLTSPNTVALVRMIEGIRKNLPNRFICATSWGPFTWAMILCDWNMLREKLTADRLFIIAVCELGVRLSIAFFDLLMDLNLIDGISVPEGAVTLISVSEYRDLLIPLEKALFDHVRRRGTRSVLHMCGEIGPQLSLYPHTGADCISVDSHVTMREAYNICHDVTVAAGNVDVITVIEKGDEALIRGSVSDCVGQVADSQVGYILMPSCDLPVNTPVRNVRTFLSCADLK